MTIVAIANQSGAAGGVDAGIAPIGPLPMTGEAGAFDAVMATLLPVVPPVATAAPVALPAAAIGPGRGDATDTGALPDAPHVVGPASALATSIVGPQPSRAIAPDADTRGTIDPVPVSGPAPVTARQLPPEGLAVPARHKNLPPAEILDQGGRWAVMRRVTRAPLPEQFPEHVPEPPFATLAVLPTELPSVSPLEQLPDPPPTRPPLPLPVLPVVCASTPPGAPAAGPALHVARRQLPVTTDDTFAASGARAAANDGISSDADGVAVSLFAGPAVMASPADPIAPATAIAPAPGNLPARRLVEMPDTPAPPAAALAAPNRRKEPVIAATGTEPPVGTATNGIQPGLAASVPDNAIVIANVFLPTLQPAPPIITTPAPAAKDSAAVEARPWADTAPAGWPAGTLPVANPPRDIIAGPPVVAAAEPDIHPIGGWVQSSSDESVIADAPGVLTAVPPLVPQPRGVASAGQISASVTPPFAPEIPRNPPPAPARALALPMPRRELPRPAPDPQPVAAPISPMGIPPATTSATTAAAIADVVAAPAAIADMPPEPGFDLAIASARLGPVRITVEGGAGDLRIAMNLPAASVALVSADAPRLVADLAAQGVRLAALDIGGGQPGMQQSPQQQGDQRGRYAPANAVPLLAEAAGIAPRAATLPRPDRYA